MSGNSSYWDLTCKKERYPRLSEDTDTDVLVIGGGITGVTCAYCLAERGFRPLLIEAGELCGGTTGNTTGKVTIQHGVIYCKIKEKYGLDAARDYAASQNRAMDFVAGTAGRESIDCALRENTAYIYGENEQERDLLQKEYDAARSIGINARMVEDAAFPSGNKGLLAFPGQYVFHPVRYVEGLAAAAARLGARICCDTKASGIDDGDIKTVECENGAVIKARHVIAATQYPFLGGLNLFFARLYPKRTYGIAARALRDRPEGSYINVGDPTRSIRTHVEGGETILIVVGEGHDTGRSPDMAVHFDNLARFAEREAGAGEVIAKWSAQDYDTPDELPYIGRVSPKSDIYIATGFSKWGLTNGTLAGMMISELIQTGKCANEDLYSVSRPDITSSVKKAFAGAVNPVIELVKSKFEGTGDIGGLKPGEGRIIRYEGEKAGIYMDGGGNVTVLDITCTHMKTELNFNSAEKTWDCPAHGGRFDTDGNHLEGPPRKPLKVLFKGRYSELIS